MIRLADGSESVECHLDKGLSDSYDIDELFGHFRGAQGPEPAPDSSGHYYDMGILHNCSQMVQSKNNYYFPTIDYLCSI